MLVRVPPVPEHVPLPRRLLVVHVGLEELEAFGQEAVMKELHLLASTAAELQVLLHNSDVTSV